MMELKLRGLPCLDVPFSGQFYGPLYASDISAELTDVKGRNNQFANKL